MPYFNAPIFLQNKTQIGKIEEIFGCINDGVSLARLPCLQSPACNVLPAETCRTAFLPSPRGLPHHAKLFQMTVHLMSQQACMLRASSRGW